MKKLLVILPLIFAMAVSAQEKDKKSDKKEMTTVTLDGRAFKVTLKAKAMDDKSTSEVKKSDNISTPPNVTPKTAPDDRPIKEVNKSLQVPVEENAMDAPVDKTATGQPDMNKQTTTPSTTEQNSKQPADKTSVDQKNVATTEMQTFENKKMIINFENGVISSSGLTANGIENCPYHVNTAEGTLITFSSNCKSSITKVKALWSGMVDGNSIRGNFTWITDDGTNVYYTFTGTKASQKDIDVSRELGMIE